MTLTGKKILTSCFSSADGVWSVLFLCPCAWHVMMHLIILTNPRITLTDVLFCPEWIRMDELRQHVSCLPLCEFLWNRSRSHPMVHSCRAVQSGASACSHRSGWLLQLEQQLPHSHDFSIHTGRQNITETHTCCQIITSQKLLTLVFFFLLCFSDFVGFLRVHPVCCAASRLHCLHLFSGPRDQGQKLWGDCQSLQQGPEKVIKPPRRWYWTAAAQNIDRCVKQHGRFGVVYLFACARACFTVSISNVKRYTSDLSM